MGITALLPLLKDIACDVHFENFLWKGGRNRRLLLASQNCYFLCRRDNFGIEATWYIDMCMKDTDLPIENNMQPILVFQEKLRRPRQMWNPPPLTCCC
ncbi:unnamed protein product [Porites lobata]|uniref:Uncharacterized protein n=1 Tax=Porites lobata TaxID=104759 RepID=A0ABN8NSF9_9CNID|nr:unnamed protein product [Porites lobata]